MDSVRELEQAELNPAVVAALDSNQVGKFSWRDLRSPSRAFPETEKWQHGLSPVSPAVSVGPLLQSATNSKSVLPPSSPTEADVSPS